MKITSDPIEMEEEDNCLGSLLSSSHCTLVADSILLVTPCNTRLAKDIRPFSLIFFTAWISPFSTAPLWPTRIHKLHQNVFQSSYCSSSLLSQLHIYHLHRQTPLRRYSEKISLPCKTLPIVTLSSLLPTFPPFLPESNEVSPQFHLLRRPRLDWRLTDDGRFGPRSLHSHLNIPLLYNVLQCFALQSVHFHYW